MAARRKFWGWGNEDQTVSDEEAVFLARLFAQRFGASLKPPKPAPKVSDFALRPSRLTPPASIVHLCSIDPHERLVHAYGKSFPDYVRMFQRNVPHPPDVVAYPENESDVTAVLDWAARKKAAVVPFGGGSSVCGGVECDVGEAYAGVVSLDMGRMGKVRRDRPHEPRGAHSSGRVRARARGAAEAARADVAAFSAELRVFDVGRVDRDAVGRALSRRSIRISTISSRRCASSRRRA